MGLSKSDASSSSNPTGQETDDFVLAFAWHDGNLTPIKVANGSIVDGNDLSGIEWKLTKDDLLKMTRTGLIAIASRADRVVENVAEEDKRQKMTHAELVEFVHPNFDRIVSETASAKGCFHLPEALVRVSFHRMKSLRRARARFPSSST